MSDLRLVTFDSTVKSKIDSTPRLVGFFQKKDQKLCVHIWHKHGVLISAMHKSQSQNFTAIFADFFVCLPSLILPKNESVESKIYNFGWNGWNGGYFQYEKFATRLDKWGKKCKVEVEELDVSS